MSSHLENKNVCLFIKNHPMPGAHYQGYFFEMTKTSIVLWNPWSSHGDFKNMQLNRITHITDHKTGEILWENTKT